MNFVILLMALGLIVSEPTQTFRGTVKDAVSEAPIAGATVKVMRRDSVLYGAVARTNGAFRVPELPIGTYRIVVSMVGYEPYVIDELQVT